MRFRQIIEEIREKSTLPPHRAAYDVCQLLRNNKHLFAGRIDQEDLKILLRDLETLSESHPSNYSSPLYKREAEQVMGRLMVFLDRMY